jgi:hypothetical protein
VALVNDKARMNYFGFTVLTNEKEIVPVESWEFADLIEEKVVAAVRPLLRNEVARLDLKEQAGLRYLPLTEKQLSGRFDSSAGYWETRWTAIRESAVNQGFGCLIAVWPVQRSTESLAGEPIGLGLLARMNWGFSYFVGMTATMLLPERSVVASRSLAYTPEPSFLDSRSFDSPYVSLKPSRWLDPDDAAKPALTPTAVADFRESLGALAESIAANVAAMFAPPRP